MLRAHEELDDSWQTIHHGTTLGDNCRASLDPVTARYVRLDILDAIETPTLWEFY